MYYEVNVSLSGHHFFATHKRSIVTNKQLTDIISVFSKKFPEHEGYEISISLDKQERYQVDYHEVLSEITEDQKHDAHMRFIQENPNWED